MDKCPRCGHLEDGGEAASSWLAERYDYLKDGLESFEYSRGDNTLVLRYESEAIASSAVLDVADEHGPHATAKVNPYRGVYMYSWGIPDGFTLIIEGILDRLEPKGVQ